jgi:hypothetical protein
VQFEELRYICQEAAIDVLRERGRPVPPTLVLPGQERTRLLTLPGFPEDDEDRHTVLAQVAEDELTANEIPCWGFVSEAEVGGSDAVVVVFGARRHAPHITASPFGETGELEEFVASEELDPTALPFLHPLQHAVDALAALPQGDRDTPGDPDDPLGINRGGTPGSPGLPMHPGQGS